MKKILFMFAFAMVCEKVTDVSFTNPVLYRCENEEVVCYTSSDNRSGISCNWKN